MEISLIIPTYRSEKTIDYCLNSVMRQSFNDFECLVIDYNVDNKTKDLVDLYTKIDKRIKYIESPYKGAIAQREYGIKQASGNYVCFLDSDDFVHPQYLAILYTSISESKTDLATCSMTKVNDVYDIKYNSTLEYNTKIITNKSYQKLVKNYRKNIGSPTPVCIIAKRTFFISATYFYNKNLNVQYWEDAILSYFLYFHSNSITVICSHPVYYYINNNDSITNKTIDHNVYVYNCFKITNVLENMIKTSKYTHYERQIYIYSVFGMIDYLLNTKKELKKEFMFIRNEFKKYGNIHKIKAFEYEYTFSESLLALSIKYKLLLLTKMIINRLHRKKTQIV